VYVVFLESGKIHTVCSNPTTARKVKKQLENFYENATIKEYDVT
jgi:hypothetical protein